MRSSFVLVFSSLVLVAASCGGKTTDLGTTVVHADGGGTGTSSSGLGPGSSSGVGSSASSGGVGSSSTSSGSSGSSGIGSSSSSGVGSGSGPIDAGSGRTSYDGTEGKACATDSDCHSPTGPGTNKCTSDGFFAPDGVSTIYPTAVCLNLANCDPGDGTTAVYCDGDPTNPSSPGVCLSLGAGPGGALGLCLPQCNFKQDGSAATGCHGKDACHTTGFYRTDAAGATIGIGYCLGGCDVDADCAAGQHCQADQGFCVKTLAMDQAAGTSCDRSSAPLACKCIAPSSGLGYCAQFCVVGRDECTTGTVCEASLPTSLVGAGDASVGGWTTQNPGLGGWCAPTCTGTGGTCAYPNSTCQTGTVAGPDCQP
jgi:hypothetical protein